MITGTTGGMLVSGNKEWVERARKWSQQSRDLDPQGINNYIHSELGFNYRMSNVIAGIVLGQFEVLAARVERRRNIFARYFKELASIPGIVAQPEPPDYLHTRWLSCFQIDERKFGMSASELIRLLDSANVESRPVWRPMHLQPYYQSFESVGGEVSESLHNGGICLPSSSSLSEEEQSHVIGCIHEAAGLRYRL